MYTYAAEYTGGHFDEIKSDKRENGHRKGCPKRHSFPQTKRKVHHEPNCPQRVAKDEPQKRKYSLGEKAAFFFKIYPAKTGHKNKSDIITAHRAQENTNPCLAHRKNGNAQCAKKKPHGNRNRAPFQPRTPPAKAQTNVCNVTGTAPTGKANWESTAIIPANKAAPDI